MRDTLKALHGAGVAHGDIRASNFLVVTVPNSSVTVLIVDFGQAILRATPAQLKADKQRLTSLLQ